MAIEHAEVRKQLEEIHGQVWTTHEMMEDFQALGFQAPYVLVERRSDKVRGLLQFQHSPRFYFNFKEST